MPDLQLFLLGSPRIALDGIDVQVETRKALALLAYLTVTGSVHRRERLAALLWPESDQSRARASLRYTLATLKHAIGNGYLEVDRETLALVGDDRVWIDVARFRRRVAACRTHEHAPSEICSACMDPLTAAAALYRGDFLAGFTLSDSPEFDEWQFFEPESLRREMTVVLERLMRLHADAGDHEPAIDYARRLVALDPLHEPGHRQLMQLYAQAGRRTAALRQYQECVRILNDEVGVEPAAETRALYERLQAGDLSPAREMLEAQTPRHNLPEQFTSFVGREAELATVTVRLRNEGCRLLTLLGPGGIGKTRLALEAGRHLLDDFTHGVFFASLAPLSSGDELVPAIASAVRFPFYEGDIPLKEQLLHYLRGKEILLILDNFEHLREDIGILVEMLEEATDLTLLVTSREQLNLHSEWVLPRDGLQYAGSEAADRDVSAVTLFLDRSRQAQATATDGADLAAVAEVCRLVDGMPLAIELAAAWTSVLSPEEIAMELADSLDILATAAPDVPARHRSMRAVFDTMWSRLAEPEQHTLRQFSVFRGGCDRKAAERVAGATLPILMALVHKSVLRRDPGSGRLKIHELLRQYAAEQLTKTPEERDATQQRYARYYTTFLQRCESDLKGARQEQALSEIETEYDNVKMAWTWAVATADSTLLDRSLWSLGRFYQRRFRSQEGESLFREAVERLEATTEFETRVLVKALTWHSIFTHALGNTKVAIRRCQHSLDLLGTLSQTDPDSDVLRAFVLLSLGQVVEQSDREAARQLYTDSLTLYQRHDDRWGIAEALRGLGNVALNVGRFREAETFLRESLSISEELGGEDAIAHSLNLLTIVTRHQGELEAAEQMQRSSLADYRRTSDRVGAVLIEDNLALTLILQGKFPEARLYLEGSLSVHQETGHSGQIALTLTALGIIRLHLGEYGSARVFLQDILRRWEEIDDLRGLTLAYEGMGAVALAEEHYTEAEQWLQHALTVRRGIDLRTFEGTSLAKLAFVARARGEHRDAQRYVMEALQIADDIRAILPLFDALPAAALLFADLGEPVRAVEIYGFVTQYGYVRNSRWFADVAGRHIEAVKATLPADTVTEAEEHGHARDLWETVGELLVGLRQRP